jgi:hypothetical protein
MVVDTRPVHLSPTYHVSLTSPIVVEEPLFEKTSKVGIEDLEEFEQKPS